MRMIGKPEWFTYRLDGWGIVAKAWQGWAYMGVFIALIATTIALPIHVTLKFQVVGILVGVLAVDTVVIWAQLGKHHDERQRLHQLVIERNCSLAGVFSVIAAMGYQVYQNRSTIGIGVPFDPLLLAVLGVMALTKLISTIYVRFKM